MSSKVFPSTGDKPRFDPNAAYEAVQDTPVPKGKKPVFNPNKQYEAVHDTAPVVQQHLPALQPAFQVQISQPTFRQKQESTLLKPGTVNEPINVKKEEVSYVPDERTIELEKLKGKAQEAHKKIHAELLANDDKHEQKIREYRRDNYTIENLRNDYKEAGQILAPQDEKRLLQREKQRRYEMPVTPEEISDAKTGTILDESNARKFLKNINNSDVSSNSYIVDKYNEIAGDPNALERMPKIKSVEKEIKSGRVFYDPEARIAYRPVGLIGSMMEGVKNKFKMDEKHDFYKNTENDAAIIKELEEERNNPDTDTPINVPKGKVSEFVKKVSETPILPMVAGAAGTIGGTLIGNPELGAVAATALGAYESRKSNYTSTYEQVYNEMRNQGANPFDALAEAKRQANNAQEIGTIVGAAQGLVGARISSYGIGYQKAVGDFLKKNGIELGKIVLEGAAQGGVGAAGEVVKNKLAQYAGIKRGLGSGVAEAFWDNIMMTAGIGLAIKGAKSIGNLNYKRVMHGLTKNVPDEVVNGILNDKVQSGEITQEAADQAVARINEYKELDSQIPPNVTEEARFKIQDNIEKINELEQQKEATHKSLQEPIKEKIQKLTEDNLALSKEVDKPEKVETGLTKEKEKEAIELADEWVKEGILPPLYEGMIKQDPIGFWKMIAQNAQNMDENWRPLKSEDASLSEQTVRSQFGDTVVDYAKELFPAPEVQPSGVSVIMPGGVKQPETITIKPKENAVQEQSTSGVLQHSQEGIREEGSQRSGMESGEQGQVPARTQEGEQPKEEDNASGQEGVVEPPLPPVKGSGVFVEHPATQLSFRGLQDTSNEFGYDDVRSRDSISDIQEMKNAETTTNEWASKGEYQKNINEMLERIENKEMVPTAKQRLILQQYLANEKQKARELRGTPDYDAQLAKVKRIRDIGLIARQEAGAALRIPEGGSVPHPVNDVIDAMAAKMEANKVDVLTDQQKAEVEAQVEAYRKRSEEADAKVAELEAKVANMDSQKEFNKVKSSTKRTKKTTEERIAYRRSEIEAAREALKKLRSGESGFSAVPLPGVRELMAIAPHVKNIMVDLVAQGIDSLEDIVKHLHTEFRDVLEGVSEKDIHDIIAGEYNEKGKSLSELQRQIKDLQDEAKYINQLESLMAGKEPKAERAKRERNRKIKGLKDKIKDFRKGQSDSDIFYKEELDDDAKALIAIKKRNQKRAQEIREKIAKGQFEKEAKKSIFDREDIKKNYPRLRKDALDAIANKEEAQHEFDLALYKDEMEQRSKVKKFFGGLGKVIHTSKAVMSGIDDSATFVQNGLAMLANPKIGAKVWVEHWKDAFSDARFKRELSAIHQRPDWEIIKNSGLDIVEPHSAASKQVEEAFEQNLLAGKIKIGGKEFQPWKYTGGIFERAFTSMGNNMRLALFEKQAAELKDAGKTFESHPEEYKAAARAVNELTGRGQLPAKLAQASPYITPFIWAPRMLTSTINTLGLSDLVLGAVGKGYYQNLTPTQRAFALKQLRNGVAMGVVVMGAAALGGAKVDYDPRSVTFGDVIVGDHHYNVFGRYTPVIKTIVQFAMGKRVKKDGVQDLDSGKRGAKTRMGVVGGFFRGKMTPVAGAAYDLAEHKNYFTNEPFGVKDLPAALLTPMSVKELVEGWKNDGTWTILNRFLPAFEGLKVSDERDFKPATDKSNSKKGIHKSPRGNRNKSLH